jgi:exonuclease III
MLNMYDGYECYFNSSQNKRGVGILINKKISYLVQERRDDPAENFLLLKVSIAGEPIIIGSVYGPNNTDLQFFHNLSTGIRDLAPNNTIPVLLGGDWNCTLSPDPVNINIDVINMNDIPNRRHSEALVDLCNDLKLSDPFRVLHFNKVEFSYIPRCPTKKK